MNGSNNNNQNINAGHTAPSPFPNGSNTPSRKTSNVSVLPTIMTNQELDLNKINSRSRSTSQVNPSDTGYKRNYSYSVSSVNSNDDYDHEPKVSRNKVRFMNDIDLENQLIQTAGGKREDVFWFFLKLFILLLVVLGSGVLIFYAL